MKTIVTISLVVIFNICFAQEKDGKAQNAKQEKKEVLVLGVNQYRAKPDFDLSAYLNSNLKYPNVAREEEIEGRVVIEFIVEKDGSVSGVRVVKGMDLGGGLPEEAVRVVSNMPKWIPAGQNGQVVRSFMTLPVDFKLEDKSRLNSKYQFPVDKGDTLIQGALPAFDYLDYISKQQVYPRLARQNKIHGVVVMQFIVETDSSITNMRIIAGKELGNGLPEEATRLIKSMPAWQPALNTRKKPVRSYVIAPVSFKSYSE